MTKMFVTPRGGRRSRSLQTGRRESCARSSETARRASGCWDDGTTVPTCLPSTPRSTGGDSGTGGGSERWRSTLSASGSAQSEREVASSRRLMRGGPRSLGAWARRNRWDCGSSGASRRTPRPTGTSRSWGRARQRDQGSVARATWLTTWLAPATPSFPGERSGSTSRHTGEQCSPAVEQSACSPVEWPTPIRPVTGRTSVTCWP